MFNSDALATSTDEQLDALFKGATTLGLDRFVNSGKHAVDVRRKEIFNDASWKGFLPKGLPLGEIAARLSTGYAKRFWKAKGGYLGETLYAQGRVTLKHRLEEVTLARPVNDLTPGRYIILYYTDPVFEHLFYDVMKAPTDDLILYRGYSGRFPDGRRGWTAPLMRRYSFRHMGADDHRQLQRLGTAPSPAALEGRWRLDIVGHSTQVRGMAQVSFTAGAGGRLDSRCAITEEGRGLLPGLVEDHFTGGTFNARTELRRLDRSVIVGTWTTELRGPYARLVRAGSLRMFQQEKDGRGKKRYALRYVLTRE